MTKKLPPEKKKKAGRKSLYNPEFHPKKAGELALMGKTNPEIGKILGVNPDTLAQWKKQFPEFAEALKTSKDQADAPVIKSLYQRALGYEYTEIKEIESNDGLRRIERTVKKVLPDVTAQIFWLKNRQPVDWRDKHNIEHTGNVVMHFDKEDAGL